MILQLQNVTKAFGVDVILSDVSISVNERDRIGIIGRNGTGKTTLLNIIAKELSYDSGSVFIAKNVRTGFLKQTDSLQSDNTIWTELMGVFSDVCALEDDMRRLERELTLDMMEEERESKLREYARKTEMFEKNDGFSLKAKVTAVLNGMGFEAFDVNTKVSSLSGGERTKLNMAKLLLMQPELLLLDEPTNHLDFKTMQWLENHLKTYPGAVIAVSHDRYFLNSSIDTIYEVENTHVTKYHANYSGYTELKKAMREQQEKAYDKQQSEIKKLEEYVAKNLVRASTTKMAQSRRKVLEKMEVLDKPLSEEKVAKFRFSQEYKSYREVIHADGVSLMYNTDKGIKKVASNISFDILRGEKVALVGDNGVGKSTLLKTILGLHNGFMGDIEIGRNVDFGYYDQELKGLSEEKTVFDEVYDRFPLMDQAEIRTYLGGINFYAEDVFKKVSSLSGGEKAKLSLLCLMLKKNNTLILDEPTNHLDLATKEELDDSLAAFDGTVFLVSHDRYFLNKVATKVLELNTDGVKVFEGNYDYYLEKKDVFYQKTVTETPKEKKQNTYQEEKRKSAFIKNTQKKLEQTEADIEKLDEEIAVFKAELEGCGADFEKAQSLYEKIENAETEQLSLMEKYEELEAALNELTQE